MFGGRLVTVDGNMPTDIQTIELVAEGGAFWSISDLVVGGVSYYKLRAYICHGIQNR